MQAVDNMCDGILLDCIEYQKRSMIFEQCCHDRRGMVIYSLYVLKRRWTGNETTILSKRDHLFYQYTAAFEFSDYERVLLKMGAKRL